MTSSIKVKSVARVILIVFGTILGISGCASPQLPKGMMGKSGDYDYSPTVIQIGTERKVWWCGFAKNPADRSQESDAILYGTVDTMTGKTTGPLMALAETPQAWDSRFTCNPKVVGGTFTNPLGDGVSYNYALYYVGVSFDSNDQIGVAFSTDGISWKKYPTPVIHASSPDGYGTGQPALYNSDQKSGITMFYEDSFPTVHHVKATSTDGVHFSVQGTITTNGLEPSCSDTWGDMAYDSKTGYWYALFNCGMRDPATTGGITERGQFGVELYRIRDSALLAGDSPWEPLTTLDTNATGYEANFLGGFVRDPYGTVNVGAYPTIQMYLSVSCPQPGWNASPKQAGQSGNASTWQVTPFEWVPNQPKKPLEQYANSHTNLATTGWISPSGGFQVKATLGHLYEISQMGATTSLYGCKDGDSDYFVSRDSACEGKLVLGRNGFAYPAPIAGMNLVPLYRCLGAHGHFVSQDPKCNGQQTDQLLGYILP